MLTTKLKVLVGALSLLPVTLLAYDRISPLTSPPDSVSPSSGVFAYQYDAPNLSFVWDQYPAADSSMSITPTHFLFCLQRPSDGPCNHANATANLLPTQVPRVPVQWANQTIGYRYTFTPTIPDNKLDEPVTWSVAACWSGNDSSCLLSASTSMVAATAELEARAPDTFVSGDEYDITAQARNLGSRMSPKFTARIEAWEVIMDRSHSLCERDTSAIEDPATAYVLDKKGVLTQLTQWPVDGAGPGDVVAIYRSGPTSVHTSIDMVEVVLPAASTQTLAVPLILNVPTKGRPRAFARALYLDTAAQVYEANEVNNGRAACEVVN
jgi:hypothetical protein